MSETMKAAVLYGNEDIRYADWEKPVPCTITLVTAYVVSFLIYNVGILAGFG